MVNWVTKCFKRPELKSFKCSIIVILQPRSRQKAVCRWHPSLSWLCTQSTQTAVIKDHHQIVIPPRLQKQILKCYNTMHKTSLKQRTYSTNTDIENYIKQCHTCQVITPSSMTITERNWQKLATDLNGPLPTGGNILVVIEYLFIFYLFMNIYSYSITVQK